MTMRDTRRCHAEIQTAFAVTQPQPGPMAATPQGQHQHEPRIDLQEAAMAFERFIVGVGTRLFSVKRHPNSNVLEGSSSSFQTHVRTANFLPTRRQWSSANESMANFGRRVRDSALVKECAYQVSCFSKAVVEKTRHFFRMSPEQSQRETMEIVPVIPTGSTSIPTTILKATSRSGHGHLSPRRKPVSLYVEYMLDDRPLVYQNVVNKKERENLLKRDVLSSPGMVESYSDPDLQLAEFMTVLSTACKNEQMHRK